MALLAAGTKDKLWRYMMRVGWCSGAYVKATLRTAFDDADSFLDTNATAINNAFNATFRAAASTFEKTAVVCLVAAARAGTQAFDAIIGTGGD